MYKQYVEVVTRSFPFLWSHRLEIPLIGGSIGWAVAIILGFTIDMRSFAESQYRFNNVNTTIFMLFGIVMFLVTLIWLVSVSRTLPLIHSIKASKYPILAVVVTGGLFLSAPPYIFANMAVTSFGPAEVWPLFDSNNRNQIWDSVGLFFGLSYVSIASSFAVLVRKTNLQISIVSLFVAIALFVFGLIITVGIGGNKEWIGLVIYAAVAGSLIVANVVLFKGVLFRFHEIVSGITLFCFSHFLVAFTYMIWIVSEQQVFDFWRQVILFVVSLFLSELVLYVIRGKRYLAT